MASSLSTVLLETKLHRPRVPQNLIARPRLYAMLDRGVEHPLTLVCAAAGFGKTTLVSAWIESHSQQESPTLSSNVAWLALSEQESELDQFVRYFVGAVRTVIPDACSGTQAALDRGLDVSISLFGTLLANDLMHLPRKVTIVLDDCHLINGTDVYELLATLLEHPPDLVNLILISRFIPPLPLSKLRAKGVMVDISNQDMRFTRDEVHAYMNRAVAHPLNQPTLEILEDRLEGWIAGLQLVTMSLRDVEDIDAHLVAYGGSAVAIFEFLLHEIVARLPPAVKSFLCMTAILEQFSVELCENTLPHDDPNWDAATIIDYLIRANLFTTRVDVQEGWYRYHPMFRDLLRSSKAAAVSHQDAKAFLSRTAYWYERQGLIEQAVKQALLADDVELATQIMERGLSGVLNCEDQLTVERWLRSLPADVVESRPGLLIIKAYLAVWNAQPELFFSLLGKVEQYLGGMCQDGIEHSIAPRLCIHFAALKCVESVWSGNLEQAVTLGRQVLATAPPDWAYVRSGVANYVAVAMQAIGRGDEFEQEIWQTYENLDCKTDAGAKGLLLSLCFINLQTGRLAQVESVGKLLLDRFTLQYLPLTEAWTHLCLGIGAYQTNQLDEAARHFSAPIEHSYRTSLMIVQECMAGMVSVHLARGQYAEAAELVDALAYGDLQQRGHWGAVAQSVAARALLANNDIGAARAWGERCLSVPVRLTQTVLMELPQLSGIRTLLAGGAADDIRRARDLADELYAHAAATHNTRRMIEAAALQALIFDMLNDAVAAEASLFHAVQLASEGTVLRPFVDLGPRIHDLLTLLTVPASLSMFVAKILAAFPEHAPNRSPESFPVDLHLRANGNASSERRSSEQRMVEPLTHREIQVVALLCEPLGIKEIARMLNISYATAKRHSVNAYGKLGVNSRWDAVKKAKSLGIIG